MTLIRFKRGTRAQLDAAAASGLLNNGEPYFITDESQVAVGTSATTYSDLDTAWGDITGTLANQTDLQAALDTKANLTGGNVWDGINTFPNQDLRILGIDGTANHRIASATSSGYSEMFILPAQTGVASLEGHGHDISEITSLQSTLDGKVAKAGDTMTGNLTIQKSTPQIVLNESSLLLTFTLSGADAFYATTSAAHTFRVGATTVAKMSPSGDFEFSGELVGGSVPIARLDATGTASASTYLRGDGQWITPPDNNTTYSVGNGLTSSGTVFSLGTPSTITTGTTNSTTASSHTHALTLPTTATRWPAWGEVTSKPALFEDRGTAGDLNAATSTGVYRLNTLHANTPAGSDWQYGTLATFDNSSDTGFQLLSDYHTGHTYIRGYWGFGSTWAEWSEIWTSTTDGSGSGLDADLLDGQHGSYYFSPGHLPTWGEVSGKPTTFALDRNDFADGFNNSWRNHGSPNDFNSITNFGPFFINATTNGPGTGAAQFYGIALGLGANYSYNSYNMQFAIPRNPTTSQNILSWRSRENGTWQSWRHTARGNADGKATDADLLDGLHASSFLRSDASDIKTSGYTRYNDNTRIDFGSGHDMRLYHNGSNSLMDLYNFNFLIRDGATTRFTFARTTGSLTCNDVIATSDIRLKDNIAPLNINDCLNQINELIPSSFTWKESGESDTGLIAQQVQEVLPERVKGDDELAVSYAKITTQLIGAVKALTQQNEELTRRIEELEAR